MLTKKYTILEPFAKEAWKKFTFKEIKKLSCNKSDNYVHTVLKRFVALEVLQEQKIGNNPVQIKGWEVDINIVTPYALVKDLNISKPLE